MIRNSLALLEELEIVCDLAEKRETLHNEMSATDNLMFLTATDVIKQ